MRPCINSASAHLPWQPLIRKYNRGLGVKSNRNIWNKSIRPQGFWKQICKYLHLRRILSYHLHPRVTSYGRDDISVFAKLHNFLISERLLMYLQSSLSAGWWDIKCITLYFYCRAPFLLPLRIAVRENRSRNPYFIKKKKKEIQFLVENTRRVTTWIPRCDDLLVCRAYTPPHIQLEKAIDQVKKSRFFSPLRIAEGKQIKKSLGEKAAQNIYSLLISICTRKRGLEENELLLACYW